MVAGKSFVTQICKVSMGFVMEDSNEKISECGDGNESLDTRGMKSPVNFDMSHVQNRTAAHLWVF